MEFSLQELPIDENRSETELMYCAASWRASECSVPHFIESIECVRVLVAKSAGGGDPRAINEGVECDAIAISEDMACLHVILDSVLSVWGSSDVLHNGCLTIRCLVSRFVGIAVVLLFPWLSVD
jgi:hypothetical protein